MEKTEQADGQDDVVEMAIRAIAHTFRERPHSDTLVAETAARAQRALSGRLKISQDELKTRLSAAFEGGASHELEVEKQDRARWFEVPVDDYDDIPTSRLDLETPFRHLYYELLLGNWFREWDYEAQAGPELDGERIQFTPDLLARLQTLHGNFQIVVLLFCTHPVDTYRDQGMLENLRGYAPEGKTEFGQRDIALLVTPFSFGERAQAAIKIAEDEQYFVVTLESAELLELERFPDAQGRKERLQEIVKQSGASENLSF